MKVGIVHISHISPTTGSSSCYPPRNTSSSSTSDTLRETFLHSHRIATPSPSSSSSNLNDLKSHLPESVVQYLIQVVEQKVK